MITDEEIATLESHTFISFMKERYNGVFFRLLEAYKDQRAVIDKANEMAREYMKFFGVDPGAIYAHEFLEFQREILKEAK